MTLGYQHPEYMRSLSEYGEARFLSRSRGWILCRPIPGSDAWDAMGAYPIFSCLDWQRLDEDLQELESRLVSLTVVTDPFGPYLPDHLRAAFPHLMRAYKEHFILDLSCPREKSICAHHRRNAQKALRKLEIERCDPESVVQEWISLYAQLVLRHDIKGMAAFSPAALAAQLQVPGMIVLRAIDAHGNTAGMTLWSAQGAHGYYHLSACSPRGYELKAAFALFWRAWEELAATGVRWVNLGAGAGIENDPTDGLSRFKRGWATETRTAFLCGRILNAGVYAALSKNLNTRYFPAYRDPVAIAAAHHDLS